MLRKAVKHELENIWAAHKRQFEDIDINSIELFLDITEPYDIIDIIKNNETRFKHIIYEIFKRTGNNEMYRNVGDGVYEMRFNGRPNARILCKEVKQSNSSMKIIMCKGIKNKGTTGKSTQEMFKVIEKYNFEFYKNYQDYEKDNGTK